MELLEEDLRGLTVADIAAHSASREEIAMAFFELATQKEGVGQLNDAADFYRKAFKLNERVDLEYRERLGRSERVKGHDKEGLGAPLENVAATGALDSSRPQDPKNQPVTKRQSARINTTKLLALCAQSSIAYDPALPTIAVLPDDILEHILELLMCEDLPAWAAVGQSCRRLAHLAFCTPHLWRHLAGLVYPRQHYATDALSVERSARVHWGFRYQAMLNERPFIRYGGVYISKVSYMRQGERSENSNSWNLPFRIITYYRYYRFYPGGECIRLLSVLEPEKVVRRMGGRTVAQKQGVAPVSASHDLDSSTNPWLQFQLGHYTLTMEGHVETKCEGSGSSAGYQFVDRFTLTNSSRHARHNRLQWESMACEKDGVRTELGVANERDFFFSRVGVIARGEI